MSLVRLNKSILRGELAAPVSKSAAHRALIAAFLAGGEGTVPQPSDDILATQTALQALKAGEDVIDCNESGTTLRLLIPVACALGKTVTFTGRGRLPERPIDEYLRLLPQHGITCEIDGALPLTVSGQLTPGSYAVAGDVSSQYISGLLLALPLLDGDSEIVLTTALQSKPYVDMTLRAMRDFGVTAQETETGYSIRGRQRYQPGDIRAEGDWSQAAFFLAGGALTGEVTVGNLDTASAQGDKEIVRILRRFGADITVGDGCVKAKKAPLKGITVDVSAVPDLAPVIAVLGACAEGETVMTGGGRLRVKESDRIAGVVSNLRLAGIDARATADGMVIKGGAPSAATLSGCQDHRIVMAFSILALVCEGETAISGAQHINKSYPAFFEDYNRIGGKANVIGDR